MLKCLLTNHKSSISTGRMEFKKLTYCRSFLLVASGKKRNMRLSSQAYRRRGASGTMSRHEVHQDEQGLWKRELICVA